MLKVPLFSTWCVYENQIGFPFCPILLSVGLWGGCCEGIEREAEDLPVAEFPDGCRMRSLDWVFQKVPAPAAGGRRGESRRWEIGPEAIEQGIFFDGGR